jgi:hypothetical protein
LANQDDPFADIPRPWVTMREAANVLAQHFPVEASEIAAHIHHAVQQRLLPHRVRKGKVQHTNLLLGPTPPGLKFVACPEFGSRFEVENWFAADLDDVPAEIEVPFCVAADWFALKVVGVRLASGCNPQLEKPEVAQAEALTVEILPNAPSLERCIANEQRTAVDDIAEALLQLEQDGINLNRHHRGGLQKLAMEKAGIKNGHKGASRSTFERGLRKARGSRSSVKSVKSTIQTQ